MKVSTMIRPDPGIEPHDQLLNRMADYARRIEASGFPGIWVGDLLGRGGRRWIRLLNCRYSRR